MKFHKSLRQLLLPRLRRLGRGRGGKKRSQRSEIEAELFLAAFLAAFYSHFEANKTKGIFLGTACGAAAVCVCGCGDGYIRNINALPTTTIFMEKS